VKIFAVSVESSLPLGENIVVLVAKLCGMHLTEPKASHWPLDYLSLLMCGDECPKRVDSHSCKAHLDNSRPALAADGAGPSVVFSQTLALQLVFFEIT
jgi:hypothetical protein